jgi:hypothetical protein
MGKVGLYRFIAASIFVLTLVSLDLIIGTFLVPAVLSDGEDATSAEKHPVIVYNVPYGKTFRANADVLRKFGPIRYRFRTNSLGFKDSEVRDVPLTGTKHRVLIIGDSFADGIGFSFNDTMGRAIKCAVSEQAGFMFAGRIIESGTTERLFAEPQPELARDFCSRLIG